MEVTKKINESHSWKDFKNDFSLHFAHYFLKDGNKFGLEKKFVETLTKQLEDSCVRSGKK